jgi:hypothetical protein
MSDGWTNKELQANPEGYLRWQKGQQGKAEREHKEAQEENDFQQFKKLYEERGGAPDKVRQMYDQYRSDKALAEAKKLDQEASNRMRSDRSRMV